MATKTSLAEKLAELANPAPVLQDPEDESNFDTAARVVDKFEEHEDGIETSRLRKKVTPLLSETDVRYAGKKVSRIELLREDSSPFDSNASDELESDNSEDDDDIEDFRSKLMKEASSESSGEDIIVEKEYYEGESSKEVLTDEGDSDGSDDDDYEGSSLTEKDSVVQQFSNFDLNEEIEKGKAVKAQLALWDSLLECRIKMQKILIAANKLPQHDCWNQFMQLGENEGFKENLKTGEKVVKTLLEKYIETQKILLENNPDTRLCLMEMGEHKDEKRSEIDEEEITSESDDEVGTEPEKQGEGRKAKRRKYDNEEYPVVLQKAHEQFVDYRNSTIQKWNEKTRLGSGKLSHKSFGAFEQSALKQIEQILNDRERLRRRTQMKRSVYRVLGKSEEGQTDGIEETDLVSKRVEQTREYDAEIFDDDDFYHQLLREVIERKTVDVNDPVALSRQWLEIQRLRSKMKRKVDTKASKGRKIRFDVHPKLVSFMAPLSYCETTDEAKNELFSSLFGKRS